MFASCCNFDPKWQHTTASIILGLARRLHINLATIAKMVDTDEAKMIRIENATVEAQNIAKDNATMPRHS